MDKDGYLQRIGYEGALTPTAENLRRLHRAHMLTVPFENLDIPLGRPILLDLPSLYEKVVRRRRGGFCYELNGLFGWLLDQLGFTVHMLSARVFGQAGPGPEFDHLMLLVECEERFLVDVGFGDSFHEPLRLDSRREVVQYGHTYRLSDLGAERLLERRRESAWEPRYLFSLIPHHLAEYSPMCHYHQTSPASPFTQKSVCSLARQDGRITLSNNRLITTVGAQREERDVADEAEYRTLLQSQFGIELGEGAQLSKLMDGRLLHHRTS